MRILIYGINYAPEVVGVGKYTTEMAEWLRECGHHVRVVTAPPYYPAWKVGSGYRCWRYTRESLGRIELFRCPLWVPKKPSAPARLLHLLSFAIFSIPAMLRQISWRPDMVLVIEPTLFCAPVALLTAWLANARAWLHIQDYEVEAFFGLGYASGAFVKRLVTMVEGWLMRRFDRVSSISLQMVSRLASFNVSQNRTLLIPNWVDTNRVRPGANGRDFRGEWGMAPGSRIVLYAGTMGDKQGLDMLIDTAGAMQADRPELVFLLVGDGSVKDVLVEKADKMGVRNVVFKPPQPAEDLPALLALADIHLVVQRRGAGGAVMPSKLTGILAAGGTAIITADEDTELGRLVAENPGIGILVPPEDPARFREALLAALLNRRGADGSNPIARKYAEQHLAADVVLPRFERMLSAGC
jgi:colanic acid biosynthesis glycosyl transferase WcaI